MGTTCNFPSCLAGVGQTPLTSTMLKADHFSSQGEHGITLPIKGKEAVQDREGHDITPRPLSYWALGEKLGERLRGVPGGVRQCEKAGIY